jgi:hypothetical protein
MDETGSVCIPLFKTLIADGVFHVESLLHPLVVPIVLPPPDT